MYRSQSQRGTALFPFQSKLDASSDSRKVRVREPIGPHALPLKAADNGVAPERLLVPAHLRQLFVAVKDIVYNNREFRNKLPILVGRNHL